MKRHHASGTVIFDDMRSIGELRNPDIALLPIGNQAVMGGPFEAAHAVRLPGVSHVGPIHHGTFHFLTGTPEEFRRHVGEIAPGVTVPMMRPADDLAS